MPAIHDYRCSACGAFVENSMGMPEEKCCENSQYEITFQNWKSFNYQRDYSSSNDTHTTDGIRRKFRASEDPIVQFELGLIPDHGIRSFDENQAAHFREKMMKDGDTPALRREILRERTKTQKAEGFTAQETE